MFIFHGISLLYYEDIKQQEIEQRGDTLIIVPFWWDGKEERYKSEEIGRQGK